MWGLFKEKSPEVVRCPVKYTYNCTFYGWAEFDQWTTDNPDYTLHSIKHDTEEVKIKTRKHKDGFRTKKRQIMKCEFVKWE